MTEEKATLRPCSDSPWVKSETASEAKIQPRSDTFASHCEGRSPEAIPELVFGISDFTAVGKPCQDRERTMFTFFTFSPTKATGFSTFGVTKSLQRRTYAHQGVLRKGFAKRYVKAM